MYSTIGSPYPANDAFVEQFRGYVQRWMQRMQSQRESQGAGSDATGPGRPRELPAAALWSSLLLCVLDRAQGVRDLWRALVCQGYDICDQAVYARLDRGGIEPLQGGV